ncbi:MAG: hypothetical protein RR560_03215 [Hydrogenoanaerobacterium sp.]
MQKRSSKTSADRGGIYPRQKQPATGRLFARTLGALAACSIPTDSCKKEVARQALTVGESTRGRNSLPQADCLRAPLVRLLPV